MNLKKNFINKKVNISNKNYYLEDNYYIISKTACFLSKKQVDSCITTIRFFIRKSKKKKTKHFINCMQYNIPITQKHKNARMGSGKGKIKQYLSKINMNGILFIFKKIKKAVMLKIYKYIQYKLPMKVYLKTS